MFSVMQEEIPNQDEVSNEVTKDKTLEAKLQQYMCMLFLQQLLLLLLLD